MKTYNTGAKLFGLTLAAFVALFFVREAFGSDGIVRTLGELYPGDTREHQLANISLLNDAIKTANANDLKLGRANYILALQYQSLGQTKDAILAYKRCVALNESEPGLYVSAWNNLGLLYRKLEDRTKFQFAMTRVADQALKPGASRADRQTAIRDLTLEAQSIATAPRPSNLDFERAINALERAKKLSADDGDESLFGVLELLGEFNLRAGNLNTSNEAFATLLKAYPNNDRSIEIAYYQLQKRYGLGKIPSSELATILKSYPNGFKSRILPVNDLASAYLNESQVDRAVELLNELLTKGTRTTGKQLDPIEAVVATAGLKLITIQITKQNIDAAQESLHQLIELYPNSEYAVLAQKRLMGHKVGPIKSNNDSSVIIGTIAVSTTLGIIILAILRRKSAN